MGTNDIRPNLYVMKIVKYNRIEVTKVNDKGQYMQSVGNAREGRQDDISSKESLRKRNTSDSRIV